jgi:KaiC/GvpD/RAD55 family RecA-like ATPase
MASPHRSLQVFLDLPLPDFASAAKPAAIAVPDAFKVVPAHLKGQKATGELGYPPMDKAQLDTYLGAIPNPASTDRDDWLAIGAAVYKACKGADYGLDSWKHWSEQNPKYQTGDSGCEPVWRSFDHSPPTRTGAGKLVKRARLATGNPNWGPPPLQSSLNGGTPLPCGGVQSAGSGGTGGGQTNGAGGPGVVGSPAQSGHPSALAGGHLSVTSWVTTPVGTGLDELDLSNLPHTRWLYGVDLIRGEVTVVASPGGVGKSSLAIGMAMSLVAEKDLLGEMIWGKGHKVLYINGEDTRVEIKRRVAAFSQRHGVTQKDLAGRLLLAGTDNWQMQKLSLLHTENQTSVLDENGVTHLESLLRDIRPDLLVIDPLVNFCGGGNMNDNAVMAQVMRTLKQFAAKYDCAVMVVHHTRKGGDLSNQEAVSGAATIVNLSRRTLQTIPMTEREAKELGVLPSDQWRYFKVVATKSNLSPRSDHAPWYELASVALNNPETPTYPTGDRRQAVVRANLSPANNVQLTVDDKVIRRAILDVVEKGKMIDGQSYPYSPNVTGQKNQRAIRDDAMAAIRQATPHHQWHPGDLRAVVSRSIKRMLAEGWLLDEEIEKGRFRGCRALKVDWPRTPWPDRGNGSASAEDNQDTADEIAGNCPGQLGNEVSNDCPIAQAGGVGQCPPFRGHCPPAPPH